MKELFVELDGATYRVEVEYETIYVDDSFDHDWGGRRQTEVCGHREIDPDSVEMTVFESDEDGEEFEIEPDSVLGLTKAIWRKLDSIEP